MGARFGSGRSPGSPPSMAEDTSEISEEGGLSLSQKRPRGGIDEVYEAVRPAFARTHSFPQYGEKMDESMLEPAKMVPHKALLQRMQQSAELPRAP